MAAATLTPTALAESIIGSVPPLCTCQILPGPEGSLQGSGALMRIEGDLDLDLYDKIVAEVDHVLGSGVERAGVIYVSGGGLVPGLDGAMQALLRLRELPGGLASLAIFAGSAAYALAATASPGQLFAVTGAMVGSLGAKMRNDDTSRQFREGMLIDAREHAGNRLLKHQGSPGIPQGKAIADHIEIQRASVDDAFMSMVASARGVTVDVLEAQSGGQGGLFDAHIALRVGLVDGLITLPDFRRFINHERTQEEDMPFPTLNTGQPPDSKASPSAAPAPAPAAPQAMAAPQAVVDAAPEAVSQKGLVHALRGLLHLDPAPAEPPAASAPAPQATAATLLTPPAVSPDIVALTSGLGELKETVQGLTKVIVHQDSENQAAKAKSFVDGLETKLVEAGGDYVQAEATWQDVQSHVAKGDYAAAQAATETFCRIAAAASAPPEQWMGQPQVPAVPPLPGAAPAAPAAPQAAGPDAWRQFELSGSTNAHGEQVLADRNAVAEVANMVNGLTPVQVDESVRQWYLNQKTGRA